MTIHIVRSGESLESIARSYGVDPTRLAADNLVPSSGALAVGQTLVIRFPKLLHTVNPGETLSSIAAFYGTTVRKLWRNNFSLGGNPTIEPGRTLVISYHEKKAGSCPVQRLRLSLYSGGTALRAASLFKHTDTVYIRNHRLGPSAAPGG